MSIKLSGATVLAALFLCAAAPPADATVVLTNYSALFTGIPGSGIPSGRVTGSFSYDTAATGTNFPLFSVYPLTSFTMNDGAFTLDFGSNANISIVATPTISRFIAVGTEHTLADDYTIGIEGDGPFAFYAGNTALPGSLFSPDFSYVGNIEQDSTHDAVGLYDISVAVPEPATSVLMLFGLFGGGTMLRRRRNVTGNR